jgi:hypothetical protein
LIQTKKTTTISLLRYLYTILLILHSKNNIYSTNAFPNAAGHCLTGDLAGKNSPHGNDGSGYLSDGSLRVTFNDQVLSYTSLDDTNTIESNKEYTVTLSSTTTSTFRGFLFRLSGKNDQNVEGTFYVDDTDSNVQIKAGCSKGISAMTHTNRDDKTSVSFKFQYTESANADLLLEVTTLLQETGNNWFYTPFNLQIENDNEAPAPAPSPVQECVDPPLQFRSERGKGRDKWKTCEEADCTIENEAKSCPATCGTCSICVDSVYRFKVDVPMWRVIRKKCSWMNKGGRRSKRRKRKLCSLAGVSDACRETCGKCIESIE